MLTLKKKYVYLTYVLFGLAIASLAVGCFFPTNQRWQFGVSIGGYVAFFVFFIAILVVRFVFLKCPGCKKVAIQLPLGKGKCFCPKCGQEIRFE